MANRVAEQAQRDLDLLLVRFGSAITTEYLHRYSVCSLRTLASISRFDAVPEHLQLLIRNVVALARRELEGRRPEREMVQLAPTDEPTLCHDLALAIHDGPPPPEGTVVAVCLDSHFGLVVRTLDQGPLRNFISCAVIVSSCCLANAKKCPPDSPHRNDNVVVVRYSGVVQGVLAGPLRKGQVVRRGPWQHVIGVALADSGPDGRTRMLVWMSARDGQPLHIDQILRVLEMRKQRNISKRIEAELNAEQYAVRILSSFKGASEKQGTESRPTKKPRRASGAVAKK